MNLRGPDRVWGLALERQQGKTGTASSHPSQLDPKLGTKATITPITPDHLNKDSA